MGSNTWSDDEFDSQLIKWKRKEKKKKKKEAVWNGQFDSWAQRLKAQCEWLEWIHVPIEPPLCVDINGGY